MKLYIKTPFVKDNKFIPHIVEHCVNYQPDFAEFLKYHQETEAWTSTGYSWFERDDIAIEEFFSELKKPIVPAVFEREMKAISKELKSPPYGKKVYEKILSGIAGRKIRTNKIQEIWLETVQNYHQKYYVAENSILVDRDNRIIRSRGKAKSLTKAHLSLDNCSSIFVHQLSYRKELQTSLRVEYKGSEDIVFLDFIGEAIQSYLMYQSSKNAEYFYPSFDRSLTDQYFILTLADGLPPFQLSEFLNFFPLFQANYLTRLDRGRYRYRDGLIALFLGNFFTKEEHKKFIASIRHEHILPILQKFFKDQLQ